jgi:hypothetical protein
MTDLIPELPPTGSLKETHLGDGLYASFDGWQVWLRAPRLDGDHMVAIEPKVWLALTRYVQTTIDEVG